MDTTDFLNSKYCHSMWFGRVEVTQNPNTTVQPSNSTPESPSVGKIKRDIVAVSYGNATPLKYIPCSRRMYMFLTLNPGVEIKTIRVQFTRNDEPWELGTELHEYVIEPMCGVVGSTRTSVVAIMFVINTTVVRKRVRFTVKGDDIVLYKSNPTIIQHVTPNIFVDGKCVRKGLEIFPNTTLRTVEYTLRKTVNRRSVDLTREILILNSVDPSRDKVGDTPTSDKKENDKNESKTSTTSAHSSEDKAVPVGREENEPNTIVNSKENIKKNVKTSEPVAKLRLPPRNVKMPPIKRSREFNILPESKRIRESVETGTLEDVQFSNDKKIVPMPISTFDLQDFVKKFPRPRDQQPLMMVLAISPDPIQKVATISVGPLIPLNTPLQTGPRLRALPPQSKAQ